MSLFDELSFFSHLYPIAERFDVKLQAGKRYRGKITLGQGRIVFTR